MRKLSPAQQDKLIYIIQKLYDHDFDNLDVKPLVGVENTRRCRVGNLRILFEINKNITIIKSILPRGDAYKN